MTPSDVDFRLLFESVPGCHLVLSPEMTIVAVSDGYVAATMTERASILGRPLFEVFPDNPQADGERNLRASIERAIETGKPDRMSIQKYDIRKPAELGGGFEVRYWRPSNTPIRSADGSIAYLLHTVEDVTDTERLRASGTHHDQALREIAAISDRKYRQILDAAPDAMVVVGQDGIIDLVNRQAEIMFGYEREALVGKPLETLIPGSVRSAHARHTAAFFGTPRTRAMGTGIELFGRKSTGELIPVEVSLSPVQTSEGMLVSSAIRDVTERKKMERAVKVTAERLVSAVESVQDAFVLFDADDRVFLCNSVYRQLFGGDLTGAIVGRTYDELLDVWAGTLAFESTEARHWFITERRALRAEARTSFDCQTKDGRTLRVMDRRTPEGGMVETIWDLTDDAARERELRSARAAADVASAAKSEFLSSVSHELRTPLNAVLGFAQLLHRDRKEPLSYRHKERVEQILRGGEHLLHLIDDILDLSRVEAGRISVSSEPVGVDDVLRQVRATLEPAAARSNIRVTIAPYAGSPMVLADRTRFSQILMNFGSNAIEYNREGGEARFTVSTNADGRIRVAVSDTGHGIPVDKHDKLFQPFQRAGQETGPIEGTGIGLAISKRLAEIMRGDVGFTSTPGVGSEFWVDLPEYLPVSDFPRQPDTRPRAPVLDGSRRGRVLYVEDNPANVVFMRDLLSSFEGIELVVAPTGEAGVELARTIQPTVVIMDINLPGISGIEALTLLRRDPSTRSVPVIALTAAASERDRHQGEQAGFFRYLTKPVKVDELESALEIVFGPAS